MVAVSGPRMHVEPMAELQYDGVCGNVDVSAGFALASSCGMPQPKLLRAQHCDLNKPTTSMVHVHIVTCKWSKGGLDHDSGIFTCCFLPSHPQGMIQTEVLMQGAGRPVYVMGESFGGVMSLALAARLEDLVDRVVIINPATSFADSAWPIAGPLLTALPEEAYNLLPFALAPLLSNPLTMAAHDVDTTKPLPGQASDLLYGLLDLAPQLGVLRLVLPKATLAWRLQLLATGGKAVTPLLPRVQQRVLLLAGEKDLLIPSDKEAKRLARLLPRCVTKVLPDRSHAMLQEAGVDLVELMKDEGFYVQQRMLSNGMASTSAAGGGASFGRAVPIQLPTTKELDRDTAQINGFLRRVVSPVFYSTDAQGRVVRGLGAVPHGRPVLFVGSEFEWLLTGLIMPSFGACVCMPARWCRLSVTFLITLPIRDSMLAVLAVGAERA